MAGDVIDLAVIGGGLLLLLGLAVLAGWIDGRAHDAATVAARSRASTSRMPEQPEVPGLLIPAPPARAPRRMRGKT